MIVYQTRRNLYIILIVMETLSSSKTQSWLGWFLRGVLILGFVIIIGRLLELQIIKGDYYRNLAEGNRIRRVPITAPRGKILARGGEVLVSNNEVEKRIVFDPESGYEKLSDLGDAPEDEIITEWVRNYKFGSSLAHVSGYVGEVNEEEVGTSNPECPEKGPGRVGQLPKGEWSIEAPRHHGGDSSFSQETLSPGAHGSNLTVHPALSRGDLLRGGLSPELLLRSSQGIGFGLSLRHHG